MTARELGSWFINAFPRGLTLAPLCRVEEVGDWGRDVAYVEIESEEHMFTITIARRSKVG